MYTQRLLEMRQEMDAITQRVKGMRKRAAKLYTKKQQVRHAILITSNLFLTDQSRQTLQEDNTAAQKRQASLERERLVLVQQQQLNPGK